MSGGFTPSPSGIVAHPQHGGIHFQVARAVFWHHPAHEHQSLLPDSSCGCDAAGACVVGGEGGAISAESRGADNVVDATIPGSASPGASAVPFAEVVAVGAAVEFVDSSGMASWHRFDHETHLHQDGFVLAFESADS